MYQFPSEEVRKSLERLMAPMLEANRIMAERINKMMEPMIEAQRGMAERVARMMEPMVEAQKGIAEKMAQITDPLMEVSRQFAEMAERHQAQFQKIAEAINAAMEREARIRGITVADLEKAFESSAEILEGEELRKLQAVVAYNLFKNDEISFVRFIKALPPGYRPAPKERTGIPDEDFEPLVSGITTED